MTTGDKQTTARCVFFEQEYYTLPAITTTAPTVYRNEDEGTEVTVPTSCGGEQFCFEEGSFQNEHSQPRLNSARMANAAPVTLNGDAKRTMTPQRTEDSIGIMQAFPHHSIVPDADHRLVSRAVNKEQPGVLCQETTVADTYHHGIPSFVNNPVGRIKRN